MTTLLTAWAALAARVPPATMRAARSHALLHFRRLEAEHGRHAKAVLHAGLSSMAAPLPTEDAATLAPLAAAAEMLLR